MIRKIPPWASELTDELEEVVQEKLVDERGVEYKFFDDSKQIEDAINQIRIAAERLDQDRTKRRGWEENQSFSKQNSGGSE